MANPGTTPGRAGKCLTPFALVLFLCAGSLFGEPVCVLLTKEGKVEVARKGLAQWSPGETNQVLAVGDRLRTGIRSRATLRWSELSVVRVDELTSMEIQPPEKP